MDGYVTKEEYANTLREYQKSQDEMKSDARDKAKALHTMFIEQPQLQSSRAQTAEAEAFFFHSMIG